MGKYVNSSAIPKHIWTFWADCPPRIVLAFMKTWCQHNPGYELTILTLKNYKVREGGATEAVPVQQVLSSSCPSSYALSPSCPQSYVSDLDLDKLRIKDSLARISDVLRLHALSEHGGIWMDATIICTASMSWLHSIQVRTFETLYLGAFLAPSYPWPGRAFGIADML